MVSQNIVAAVMGNQRLVDQVIEALGTNICVIDNKQKPAIHCPDAYILIHYQETYPLHVAWNKAVTYLQEMDYKWVWALTRPQNLSLELFEALALTAQQNKDTFAVYPSFKDHALPVHDSLFVNWDMPLVNIKKYLKAGGLHSDRCLLDEQASKAGYRTFEVHVPELVLETSQS